MVIRKRNGWARYVGSALLLAGIGGLLPDCALVAGIEEKPCQPGCVTETSRLVCDEDGTPREEECAAPEEECFRSVCRAGACAAVPHVGKTCGEDALGACNPAGACAGPTMKVSALRDHTCALLDDGSVWCWGDNAYGEIGDGTRDFRGSPVRVNDLEPAIAIGTGYVHACAVTKAGRIYCWGHNKAGECGVPTPEPVLRPSLVPGLDGIEFIDVTAGKGHTCALSTTGGVHCWGWNHVGQSGVDPEPDRQGNATKDSVPPSAVPLDMPQVRSVVSNKNHNCALTAGGVYCWGDNRGDYVRPHLSGQIGQDPQVVAYSHMPVLVPLPTDPINVGLGFESSYAVGSDSHVYAWGLNHRGQLGIGTVDPQFTFTPTQVMFDGELGLEPLENITEVYRADGSHQCAKVESPPAYGSAYVCWGGNDDGELGYGVLPTPGENFPAARPATKIPVDGIGMSHGEDHACIVIPRDPSVALTYNDVWCWGRRQYVGDGTGHPNVGTWPPQLEPTPVLWLPPPP